MRKSEAIKLRNLIEIAAQSLSDADASTAPELFLQLKGDSSLITAGTRINWNGTIKRAVSDLWDTITNNPDNAPTLWEDIEYKKGYRIIPEVITASAAFAKDECGWWNGVLYKSLLAANTYNPDQYPTGWEIVL
jgi:hypothetical protein